MHSSAKSRGRDERRSIRLQIWTNSGSNIHCRTNTIFPRSSHSKALQSVDRSVTTLTPENHTF